MAAAIPKPKRETVQVALCLLAGALLGRIMLLDLKLKWEFAFMAGLGTVALSLMTGNPRGILLFLAAFTTPFFFVKRLSEREVYVSQANEINVGLMDVIGLALLFLFFSELARRKTRIRFHPSVTVPAVAWLVLSSLSLLVARDERLAVFQLINMLKMILLYWIVANSVRDKSDLTFVITGLLFSLLFQAAVGVYQGATGRPAGFAVLGEEAMVPRQDIRGVAIHRVQGTFFHPNSYAMYLITALPFGLIFLFAKVKSSLKAIAVAGLGLGIIALIYSLSRSGWISFLAIACLVLGLAARRKRMSPRTMALTGGLACIILAALYFFGSGMILGRIKADDHGSALSRILQARTAMDIIRDHPVLGVGLNNYTLTSLLVLGREPVVHNAYLLIAAETGLLGLLGFLGLLASLLFQNWRTARRASDDLSWAAGAGIFCAFAAIAAHSMTDYALLGSTILITHFWFLAGVSSALSLGLSPRGQGPGRALNDVSKGTAAGHADRARK